MNCLDLMTMSLSLGAQSSEEGDAIAASVVTAEESNPRSTQNYGSATHVGWIFEHGEGQVPRESKAANACQSQYRSTCLSAAAL